MGFNSAFKVLRVKKYKKGFLTLECKGKAIQLQSWTGLEGCSRLRLPDLKTVGT